LAASLLQAIGLPDAIAHTAEEYEELAFRLAIEGELSDSIKQRLVCNRATSSSFDTAAFPRNLDAAYRTMAEKGDGGAVRLVEGVTRCRPQEGADWNSGKSGTYVG